MNLKMLTHIAILCLFCGPLTAVAKEPKNIKQGPKPDDSAYEHANENARFKRDEEKDKVKAKDYKSHKNGRDGNATLHRNKSGDSQKPDKDARQGRR